MESKNDDNKKPSLKIENIYPHAYWLEKFNKENKIQSTLFENYLPNVRSGTFSPKFYSKYCEIDMTNKDYQKFIELIEKSYKMETKRDSQPVCQNQEYGWTWKPLKNLDVRDRNRLTKPKCRAELSDFAEKLEEQKITIRPKFGGLIFKL